jgi:glycine/D-amino acid oxidase-like deaminating enzyme
MSAGAPGAATQQREVVVIGGGQAGLAIGYLLAQQGRRFTILEAAGEPAAAWQTRWDSLTLFTPVRYDSLPGLTFPGAPDSYPRRDDVVAYLTDYAQRFELPVELGSRVRSVRPRDGGGYLIELADRSYTAEQVVVANGPFQVPSRRRSPLTSAPKWCSCTAANTARRATSQGRLRSSWAAGTPDSRSPRSWPGRARSTSRSARARRRFPSASSAGTCSAISKRPA